MKKIPLLLALSLTVISAAPLTAAPACCAPDSPSPAVAPPAAFTNESIYQLDGHFTDDSGRPFALGSLRGRTVVLDMFFASCGYACPLTVTDMLGLQNGLPADRREHVAFVLVTFDVAHDTPAVLARYRAERHLGDNWVLLRGDASTVRELAALIGEHFKQNGDGSFSHSNLLTVLNPEGEIVHQRTGLKGGLAETARALAVAP
ncbi:SCO family protein [Horticoccus luteus]|uniref:SCO family protein n=1 Tax=Horticoccus luteus TaxID=2862869 RepID=A0A8F9TTJ7_9BACT|nr:SCO family protein [Horticoccus luteus]QYM78780.1 SCO family protein [Horticoccus luteus]